MDLLDLAQIACIRCQNPTNQLSDQDEHSLAICDQCLQAETRKYIRIGMEIQAYQKKIKEIKEDFTDREIQYRKGVQRIQASCDDVQSEERNEMGRELLEVQQELAKEEAEALQLLGELRQLQEIQQSVMLKYHKEWISLERVQSLIGQQQERLTNMRNMQEHISASQKDLQDIIK